MHWRPSQCCKRRKPSARLACTGTSSTQVHMNSSDIRTAKMGTDVSQPQTFRHTRYILPPPRAHSGQGDIELSWLGSLFIELAKTRKWGNTGSPIIRCSPCNWVHIPFTEEIRVAGKNPRPNDQAGTNQLLDKWIIWFKTHYAHFLHPVIVLGLFSGEQFMAQLEQSKANTKTHHLSSSIDWFMC